MSETPTVIIEISKDEQRISQLAFDFNLWSVRPQNDRQNFTVIFVVLRSETIGVALDDRFIAIGEGEKNAFSYENGYWREIEMSGG